MRSNALKKRISDIQSEKQAVQNRAEKLAIAEKAVNEFMSSVYDIVSVYRNLTDTTAKNSMLLTIIDHIEYVKNIRGHGHEREFEIVLHPILPKN